MGLPLAPALCGVFLFARTAQIDQRGTAGLMGLAPTFNALLVSRDEVGPADGALAVPEVVTLERGQTVGDLLTRLGFEDAGHGDLLAVMDQHLELRRMKPGVSLVARHDRDGGLAELVVVEPGKGETVLARAASSEWSASRHDYRRVAVPRVVSGQLESTLGEAMVAGGAPLAVTFALAEVLQWDLDFTRDLRRGDRFEVVYEEQLLEGRSSGVGRILAVQYENRGRTIEAYHFGDDGYYDGEGRPLRKRFLRSPLKFTRVSSGFSSSRLHPVLKVRRPHYGVDYAAPVGTPVRVTANGVVSSVGWDRGGGRTVKVRHGKDYETAYLHLSRYAEGLRAGQRVSQGEVVGFVGSSGLATGPHLDYRVRLRGKWIDPMTLGSEPAEPLSADRREAFVAVRNAFRAAFDQQVAPSVDQLAGLMTESPAPARLRS